MKTFLSFCLSSASVFCLISSLMLGFSQPVAALEVDADVTTDTVWRVADSPVHVNKWDFEVSEGVTLTIEPGVSVTVNWSIDVLGTLSADGSAQSPILFAPQFDYFTLQFRRATSVNDNRLSWVTFDGLDYFLVSSQKFTGSNLTFNFVDGVDWGIAASASGTGSGIDFTLNDSVVNLSTSYEAGMSPKVAAFYIDGMDSSLSGNTVSVTATGAAVFAAGIWIKATNSTDFTVSLEDNGINVSTTDPDCTDAYGIFMEDGGMAVPITGNSITVASLRSARGIEGRSASPFSGNSINVSSSYAGLWGDVYGIASNASGDLPIITGNRIELSSDSPGRNLYGIYFSGGTVSHNRIIANHTGGSGGVTGISHAYGNGTVESNSFLLDGAATVNVTGLYFGLNYSGANLITVKNNIIVAGGGQTTVGCSKSGLCAAAVHNSYNLLFGFLSLYDNLSDGEGSLNVDPLFKDDDLHLSRLSSAIDAGDPSSAFANEPAPNGGRINLGAFGNTSDAVRSAIARPWDLLLLP